jgi:homoserine kinase
VIAIPPFSLATKKSRAVLPQLVSRADAVYNLGQVTLLTSAMTTGRLEWLANALGDRLHEPYREALVPGMGEVRMAAKEAGAWGVVLSGAGPALLALCPPEKTEDVVEAMNAVWEGSEVFPCSIDCRGTRVQFDDLHGIEGSR